MFLVIKFSGNEYSQAFDPIEIPHYITDFTVNMDLFNEAPDLMEMSLDHFVLNGGFPEDERIVEYDVNKDIVSIKENGKDDIIMSYRTLNLLILNTFENNEILFSKEWIQSVVNLHVHREQNLN